MTVLKPKLLQKGLTVRHRGEYVETVSSKTTDISLLSAHSQVEVVEVRLKKNARIGLTPSGSAIETFYVLEGQLSCVLPSGPQIMRLGDYIVTEMLEEPTMLTALIPSRLLYVTSKPQFHEISENVSQLRQLATEVEMKDGYTADHCDRLQALSYATGEALGLSSSRLWLLDYGAYLHDLGKVDIPLNVLNKPGKLTSDEWEIVKRHPTSGREMLEATHLKKAGVIVEQHHERLDGSGYPYGFAGDEVLVEAAIIAVADTYDAMTTDRPYRKALSRQTALEEISKFAGIHYDKEVVRAFMSIVDRVDKFE